MNKIAGESIKEIAVAIAVVVIVLYVISNHTSAETASKLGLTYQA